MVNKQLPANKTLPPPSLSLLEYPKSQLPGHLSGVTVTYGVTDRQQAAIIVPIWKFYRYFAACQNASGRTIIHVFVRYGVHYYIRPSGNG